MRGEQIEQPISRDHRIKENENRIKERLGISLDGEEMRLGLQSLNDRVKPYDNMEMSNPRYLSREIEPGNLDITVSSIPNFPRNGMGIGSSNYRDSRQRDEREDYQQTILPFREHMKESQTGERDRLARA